MDQIVQTLMLAAPQGMLAKPGGADVSDGAEGFAKALVEALSGGGAADKLGWDWTEADGAKLNLGASAKEETTVNRPAIDAGADLTSELAREFIAALRSLFAGAGGAAGLKSPSPILSRILNFIVNSGGEPPPGLQGRIAVETQSGSGVLHFTYLGLNDSQEHIFSVALESARGSITGKVAFTASRGGAPSLQLLEMTAVPAENVLESYAGAALKTKVDAPAAKPFQLITANPEIREKPESGAIKIIPVQIAQIRPSEIQTPRPQTLSAANPGSAIENAKIVPPTSIKLAQQGIEPRTAVVELAAPAGGKTEGASMRTSTGTNANGGNGGQRGLAEAFKYFRNAEALKPQLSGDFERGLEIQAAATKSASPEQAESAKAGVQAKLADIPRTILSQIADMRRLDGATRLVRLETDPPHLGPVTAKIEIRGSSLAVTFSVASAAVRESVEQQLPALRAALESLGFAETQVNVHVSTGGGDERGADKELDNFKPGFAKSPTNDSAPEKQAFAGVRGAIYI